MGSRKQMHPIFPGSGGVYKGGQILLRVYCQRLHQQAIHYALVRKSLMRIVGSHVDA